MTSYVIRGMPDLATLRAGEILSLRVNQVTPGPPETAAVYLEYEKPADPVEEARAATSRVTHGWDDNASCAVAIATAVLAAAAELRAIREVAARDEPGDGPVTYPLDVTGDNAAEIEERALAEGRRVFGEGRVVRIRSGYQIEKLNTNGRPDLLKTGKTLWAHVIIEAGQVRPS
jgi:hypothetical protein